MFTTAPQPEAEAAGSMAAIRGLTSNVLGIGGMLESAEPAKDVRLKGQETTFANPETIRGYYSKFGWGEPTTEPLKAAQFAGDIAPALGAGIAIAKPIVQSAQASLAARAAATQESNVAKSYAAAPMIEGTAAAHRLGAAVNPAISNPTFSNRARGALAGPEVVESKLAKDNAVTVTNKVREDLGLTPNQPFNADAIELALDKAGKPNDVVRKMAVLAPDQAVIDQLSSLKIPKLIGDKGTAAEVNSIIDDALTNVNKGSSGAFILDSIRQLRKQAQITFKNKDRGTATAIEVDAANARMGAANALEGLIDANVKDPNVLGNLKLARTRQAQIFDHARALDYGQQKVDPQAYAKMYEERQGKGMSGVGQDIALAASTHPSVFTLAPAVESKLPRFSRAGAGGLIGATAGSVAGPMGAAVGLAAGTGIGSVAGGLAAKRMATPAYQAARAVPTDYRPPVNQLTPAEINYGPNQLVPYDYSRSVVMPGETPNFVFGRSEAQVNVSTPYAVNQLPAPSAESTLGTVAAERARAAQMSRTLGQQTEAQQAAAEAAARVPTSGGSVLDFDPITGRYKVGGAGIKGATPEIFMSDTGRDLSTASQKVAAGQNFALSASEKVAWEKTKVDLAAAAPDLKGLSDKAIANKMMDREWANNAITKAREQAQAFDEIAARATTDQARRTAEMKREQMLDVLNTLEDQLRAPRPTSLGGQGPKTRAAIRNKLAPQDTGNAQFNFLSGQ
jgi:hypothetical protein